MSAETGGRGPANFKAEKSSRNSEPVEFPVAVITLSR